MLPTVGIVYYMGGSLLLSVSFGFDMVEVYAGAYAAATGGGGTSCSFKVYASFY